MAPNRRLSVLMTTEGTYPYVGGGVSTWCHTLCEELKDIDWHLFAVVADPQVEDMYNTEALPQVKTRIMIPLWGYEDTAEWIDSRPFKQSYRRKRMTTRRVIESEFLPYFDAFLAALDDDSLDLRDRGPVIHAIYRYFQRYDYDTTMKSQPVWQAYRDYVNRMCRCDPLLERDPPSLFDVTTCMRWLYNMFVPIAANVPETDIVHATVAASAGIAGIVSKLEYGTPFLVTDHGVYARERYIACAQGPFGLFCRRFLTQLAMFFSKLCYAYADVVAPVSHFNARWELPLGCAFARHNPVDFSAWQRAGLVPSPASFAPIAATYEALVDLGVQAECSHQTEFPWVRTIYNGVDTSRFQPGEKPPHRRGSKTVVALARVFPLKDVLTMIRSCAVVRKTIPDVQYIVYGSLKADPPYVEECRALIAELNIQDNFQLAGFHPKPHQAFWDGDISALSSISEGFPYTVIESMAAGVPVVSTDVGGCKEAIGMGADACGIVVKPRDPEAFGEAVINLLTDDRLRAELARKGRERVVRLFRTSTSVDAYLRCYQYLAPLKQQPANRQAANSSGLDGAG